MECPKCRHRLPDHAAYCSRCGANVKTPAPSGRSGSMPFVTIAVVIFVMACVMALLVTRTSRSIQIKQAMPVAPSIPQPPSLDPYVWTPAAPTLGPHRSSTTTLRFQNPDGSWREATAAERRAVEQAVERRN